jgi:hypothetical protein
MNISKWHKDFQNNFKGLTEKTYKKTTDSQIKTRIADVDLNNNYTIEFQHSYISSTEVNERFDDWALHNKSIIWVIDGHNSIEATPLTDDRYFLEFKTDLWKYDSFKKYDNIFIDIDNKIYCVNPLFVKSAMIEVYKPLDKTEFITLLKTTDNIFSHIPVEDIKQTTIYVKQQGAGNGKTYGIIQLLNTPEFYNKYDIFVYLTKQHSAVHVIYSEIHDQLKRECLNIEIVNDDFLNKKHIILFKIPELDRECKIIIGTFDSFNYSIGNNNTGGVDKFIEIAKSIIEENIKCSKYGHISYAKQSIKLNKKLLLIGDEMQDLPEEYMKAVIKLSRDKYVDFYAVGDKLQSISIEKNAYTFLENDLPESIINIIKYKPSNNCRRFRDIKLTKFVNNLIPFEKHGLVPIETSGITDNDTNNVICFEGKTIYSKHTDDDVINIEVNEIMKHYKKEVILNNRKPNDFLIVSLFVSKNPLLEALHIAIREFWVEKENINNEGIIEYEKYSVFHKSEEGTSIDLSESDDKTRIVSIHSSKGDGRPVVFVVGLTESGLHLYSTKTNNLVYNSLLHVAITRMKERLYIRYEPIGDDIHRRLFNILPNQIKPELKINYKIKYNDIKKTDIKNVYNIFGMNIIEKSNIPNLNEHYEDKQIIDLKHHCIRYATLYILLQLHIIANNNKTKTSYQQPIYQILKEISKLPIVKCNKRGEYYNKLKLSNDLIPILQLDNTRKYTNKLENIIKEIQQKLKNGLDNDECIQLDYIESIVLFHLFDIYKNKQFSTECPITDIYDLLDIDTNLNNDVKESYIQGHYYKVNKVKNIFNQITDEYDNLIFYPNYQIYYNGKSEHFEMYNKFELIGINNDNVIIFNIKPQFNALNYNETIIYSIYDTYLLHNIPTHLETDDKFKKYNNLSNKNIKTCIITLDSDEPIYFNWDHDNCLIEKNKETINEIINNNIITNFKQHHIMIYYFFIYYKNNFESNNSFDVISNIINELIKIKKKSNLPEYIRTFFNDIQSNIRSLKRRKKDTSSFLNNYDNSDYFINELDFFLEEDVESFL